jgi:hypothetical protein
MTASTERTICNAEDGSTSRAPEISVPGNTGMAPVHVPVGSDEDLDTASADSSASSAQVNQRHSSFVRHAQSVRIMRAPIGESNGLSLASNHRTTGFFAMNQSNSAFTRDPGYINTESYGEIAQTEGFHYGKKELLRSVRPSTFNGDRMNSRQIVGWVRQLENIFHLMDVYPDDHQFKVAYACSHLQGLAASWLEQYENEHDGLPATWEEFVAAITHRFGQQVNRMMARDQLANLSQKGTVRDYVQQFQHIAITIPDLGRAERIAYFRRGLKTQVRVDTALCNTLDLDELIQVAEETERARRGFYSVPLGEARDGKPTTHYPTNYKKKYNSRPAYQQSSAPAAPHTYPDDPMIIDMARVGHQQKRDRPHTSTTCQFCDKPGHTAKDCYKLKNLSSKSTLLRVDAQIAGRTVPMAIDTGAEMSVLPKHIASAAKLPLVDTKLITTADGTMQEKRMTAKVPVHVSRSPANQRS